MSMFKTTSPEMMLGSSNRRLMWCRCLASSSPENVSRNFRISAKNFSFRWTLKHLYNFSKVRYYKPYSSVMGGNILLYWSNDSVDDTYICHGGVLMTQPYKWFYRDLKSNYQTYFDWTSISLKKCFSFVDRVSWSGADGSTMIGALSLGTVYATKQ